MIPPMDHSIPDLTPLEQAAAAAHEMYLSMIGAGFTQDQSMEIVLRLISASQSQAH